MRRQGTSEGPDRSTAIFATYGRSIVHHHLRYLVRNRSPAYFACVAFAFCSSSPFALENASQSILPAWWFTPTRGCTCGYYKFTSPLVN